LYLDGRLTRVVRFHLHGPDPRTTHVVRLWSVRLYANLDDRRCEPRTLPRTVFSNATRSIDYRLVFLDWEGEHSYRVEWIRPNGRLYDSQEYDGINYGGGAWCDGELVQGQDAAHHRGSWRLRVFVDGRLRRVKVFYVRKDHT
jgi:hypothetical protein